MNEAIGLTHSLPPPTDEYAEGNTLPITLTETVLRQTI